MPPKKKTVSKVKVKKVQNPTPSGPLPTAVDEKLTMSPPNEEGSSTKEVNTPLVTSVEEKVNMLDNSEAETLKVVQMEEHEETKEADNKDSKDSKPREDLVEEPNGEGPETKEADNKNSKDSKPREDLVEEPNGEGPASTVVALEEVRVVNGETKVDRGDPTGKPDEGNKQADKELTCEDDFESVSGDDEENDEEANNDNNSSVHTQSSPPENKKQKEFELHIGGLDKGASEEDLTKVFGVYGEIASLRIARHPVTQKNKGFAFIRYVSFDHTQKALAELKDGAEVKGKKVRVSASQSNTTLYIENLCESWTKERILGTLKDYGVEQIEDILLPNDPNGDGNNKGHVFVEFKSHADAMKAFQRLKKPDAVFGLDISAKVSFSQPSIHPSKEDLLKVKTVYLEGLPKVWDLSKIQEVCKQYGEIVRTELPNFRRKKGIGFVEFSSRDSAVACVDGFNSTQFEGNINVKASFAKPLSRGRISKQTKGGFKLQNDEDTKSDNKKPSVSKKNNGKRKAIHKKEERMSNNSVDKETSNSQYKNLKEKKNYETRQSAKGNKRGRKDIDIAHKQERFKKARTDHKFNSRSSYSSNPHSPRQAQYDSVKRSGAPSHTRTSASQYSKASSYTRTSASQYSSNDLAPHAGLLPPASQARNHHAYDKSANQARNHHAYDGSASHARNLHAYDERSRGGTYHLQPASSSGAYYLQPASSYGAPHLQPTSGYGAPRLQPTSSSVHLQASTSAYAGAAPTVVQSSYPGYSSYPPGSYQVYPSSGTYNYPRSYY